MKYVKKPVVVSDDPTTYDAKYDSIMQEYLTIYSAALTDGIVAIDPKVMKDFINKYRYSSWYMSRR